MIDTLSVKMYAVTTKDVAMDAPKRAARKIGTYRVSFNNETDKPIQIKITPKRGFSNCPGLNYRIRPNKSLRVSVPRRCCLDTIRVFNSDTMQLLTSTTFKGDCVRGSTSFRIFTFGKRVNIESKDSGK